MSPARPWHRPCVPPARGGWLPLLLVWALLAGACATTTLDDTAADPVPVGVPAGAWAGTVTRITDGDTLWVEVRTPPSDAPEDLRVGAEVKLRLLRIDTPEVERGDGRGECWGDEATDLLVALAPLGTRVHLAFDVERRDRFDRWLVHLWNADGEWVNGELLRLGAAEAITIRPNDGFGDLPDELEAGARAGRRGLWGACRG